MIVVRACGPEGAQAARQREAQAVDADVACRPCRSSARPGSAMEQAGIRWALNIGFWNLRSSMANDALIFANLTGLEKIDADFRMHDTA